MTTKTSTACFLKNFAAAICSIALVAGISTPAIGAETDAAQIKVAYADLDLNSEAGRARLQTRVDQAVSAVCGERSGNMPLRERQEINSCRTQAAAKAFASVDALKVERFASK